MVKRGPFVKLTEEQREVARATRKRRIDRVNIRRLVRRERAPGEIPTARVAIQNFCRSCVGFEADDGKTLRQTVLDCEAENCWLWPYRATRAGGDE